MTGARVELDVKDASAALAKAARQAANPRGLWDIVGASLVASTQRRFERGAAPDGSPWPPSLRALAEGGRTLIDRARLMHSITHRATASGVAVGTNVVYAAIHQFGGTISIPARSQVLHFKRNSRTGRVRFAKATKATFAQKAAVGAHTVRIPARPFLGLDAEDERELEAIAGNWLLGPQGAGDADR